MRDRALTVLLVLALAPLTAAADPEKKPEPELPQWGKGILEARDPFVLAELRSSPYARSPRPLEHLGLELGARTSWQNDFAYLDDPRAPALTPLHRVTIDAESRSLDLVARLGLLDRIELGAELRVLTWRGGGVADSAIDGWHDFWGLGSLGRDKRPDDRYLVAGTEVDLQRNYSLPHKGTYVGDAFLTARVLALEGSDYLPAVSLGVRLWVPMAHPNLGHANGLAETLTLDVSKRVGSLPIVVYAGAAYTYYSDAIVDGLHLTRHRGMYYLGLEWEVTTWFSIVAHAWQETRRETRLFRHTDIDYGNYVSYVVVGGKFEPIPGLTLEVGLLENPADANTTSDVGLVANVFWRFGLDGGKPAAKPDASK